MTFYFHSGCSTFSQLFVRPQDLPSTFCLATEHSINFLHFRSTLLQLLLTSHAATRTPAKFPCDCGTFYAIVGHSVNFYRLFALPENFLSTSVNFPCVRGSSVKFPCSLRSFCQLFVWLQDLPSTFRAAAGPSLNFLCGCGTIRELSVLLLDFPSISITFLSCWVFFHSLPSTFCAEASFCHLLLTFRVAVGLFVNFLAAAGPSVNFRQFSMQL